MTWWSLLLHLNCIGPPPMNNIKTSSRRVTPWTDDKSATPLQSSIDTWNHYNYERRHPSVSEAGESKLINSIPLTVCRHCSGSNIIRHGLTSTGILRYKCKDCGKTFTALTNTIFDSRKIPISEWLDFLLDIFGYSSLNLASKGNRNASNTTKYWMDKVFLVLKKYQEGIVLEGDIQLDETYYKVRSSDIQKKESGQEPRGISRNQICIGIACDKKHVVCYFIGHGKPTKQSMVSTFSSHIKPGSHLVHDMEHSHNALVKKLELESTSYGSRELKKLSDKDNPLNDVNQYCRLVKLFLNAHSGFMRCDIQDYINLFSFIINPPENKYMKVENFINRAIEFPVLHRYRDENIN